MANWSLPTLSDLYANFLTYLTDRLVDTAKMFDGTGTNVPTNTVRWNSTTKRWEKYNGSTWPELIPKATDRYDINVDRLDGYDAGNATGNIPVSNGTVNTNLNADMVDGRHAGNAASNVLLLDASALVPEANVRAVGTAGTYRSMTTDAKGRVTAGTNPTTVAGYGLGAALQDGFVTAQTTGTNTYACVFVPPLAAYVTNQVYFVRFIAANTVTAPTLNIDARGAKTIKKQTGTGKVALVAGDIIAGGCYALQYDGTDMILINSATPWGDWNRNEVAKPKIKDYTEAVNLVAASGAALTLNLNTGNMHDITLTAAPCTITFSNVATGTQASSLTLLLKQDGVGNRTVTWPAAVKWVNGTAPVLSTAASKADIVTLVTFNGGTTWYGVLSAKGL